MTAVFHYSPLITVYRTRRYFLRIFFPRYPIPAAQCRINLIKTSFLKRKQTSAITTIVIIIIIILSRRKRRRNERQLKVVDVESLNRLSLAFTTPVTKSRMHSAKICKVRQGLHSELVIQNSASSEA